MFFKHKKFHWQISFEASLIKGDRLIAKETISGKAERVKILGQGDAEKVIGDLFTNVVNDIDIQKLLDRTQHSNMISHSCKANVLLTRISREVDFKNSR